MGQSLGLTSPPRSEWHAVSLVAWAGAGFFPRGKVLSRAECARLLHPWSHIGTPEIHHRGPTGAGIEAMASAPPKAPRSTVRTPRLDTDGSNHAKCRRLVLRHRAHAPKYPPTAIGQPLFQPPLPKYRGRGGEARRRDVSPFVRHTFILHQPLLCPPLDLGRTHSHHDHGPCQGRV